MRTYASGIGKDAIRSNNMHAVLECIYHNAPISRRDIAKKVNLTSATITLLVSDLIQYGVLRECGETAEGIRAGRRIVQLDFNPDFGYTLGICLEAPSVSMVLSYFCGRSMKESFVIDKYDTEIMSDEGFMENLVQLAANFLQRQQNLKGSLRAIGISMPGHVDPISGISLNSYGIFPPRTNVAKTFEQRFGVPAFLDNNVRALAQAELLTPSQGTVNGLFVKQDPGFGCTVLLNGEVFEGAAFSSGEIGHAQIVNNGRRCICGKTGCLSTVVSTQALIRSAQDVLSPNTTPALWSACGGCAEAITVRDIVKSAEAGDHPIIVMLEEAAVLMERILESSLLLMDGDTVITFGSIFEGTWFSNRLQACFDHSFGEFRQIRVIPSGLAHADRWKGAVAVAQRKSLIPISSIICENQQ